MTADPKGKSRPFIFLDPHGKRWPRFRRVLFLLGLILFAAVIWFAGALFVKPDLRLPAKVRKIKGQLRVAMQQKAAQAPAAPKASWRKYFPAATPLPEHPKPPARARKNAEIHLGFYSNWDANSYASLLQHASQLTHVCPEWMSLVDGAGTLRLDNDDRVAKLAASKGIVLMPMLNNLVEDKWRPEAVENLVNGAAERREKFILSVLSHVQEAKAGGVVINWEQIDPTYKKKTTELLRKLAAALHAIDKQLWLVVPMGDEINAFDLVVLADSVDRFVALLYDENSETDAPGPIASQDWFDGWLSVVLAYGEPRQWIAAIGAFGYDWTTGVKKGELISFADAMSRASYAKVKKVEVQPPNYNGEYTFEEQEGGEHTVVFLDAITFLNQLNAARNSGVGGIGIGRLGTEDPKIWDLLATPLPSLLAPATLAKLRVMKADETITNVGRGEIITVDDAKDDGVREVKMDKDNWRVVATYADDVDPKLGFPTYPILYHQGAGEEHNVVLTFDDGPDPKWTPKVLDLLKARGLKAVFFVVGKQAEEYPGLVRRIVKEGHEIGSHTYTHSNLAEASERQIELELNGTQWLIEGITGRSTILFRPPYNADSRPSRMEELRPLKFIHDELKYMIVMETIDPEDWGRPGSEVIVQRVKDLRSQGNVVLLHDAGGPREQTLEALPQIIDYLQTRGDKIVSLGELLHIPRDELMPPANEKHAPFTFFVTSWGFLLWRSLEQFGWAFMIVATVLIVLRTLIVAVLAAGHHRKTRAQKVAGAFPPVTVIIAAFNESKVIAATLRSVLDTDYVGALEVLVVNDGSNDDTASVVELAAATEPRIRLITQSNSGKSEALIRGVSVSKHDVLVFLDADTHFERSTLRKLVQPFDDPKIGAVSGHAKVGNLRTFIARCQALEYVCGFNLDRRAYAVWNCITVVPGAISALRKKAVEDCGGFSHDTLAEDTDLTLEMHRHDWRVDYVHDAIAHTEAPETVRSLARQRFRWAFGTLQCLWKHRDLTFNPQYGALGLFSLPSVWFFQILLVALTPVVDLMLVFSLVATAGGGSLSIYFATFLIADFLLAALACLLEGEKLRKAWIIIPMRLIYRPLLSWVIWRAILRALKGAFVTWGKLDRTASVVVRSRAETQRLQ